MIVEALLIVLVIVPLLIYTVFLRFQIAKRARLPNMKPGDTAVKVKLKPLKAHELQPLEVHGMTEVKPEDIAAIVAAEETLEAHFENPSRVMILDSIDYLNEMARALDFDPMEADLTLSDEALNQARLDYQAALLDHREKDWEARPDRKTPAELKVGESIWLAPDCFVRSNLPIHDFSIGVYKRLSGFVAPHKESQIEVRMTEVGLMVRDAPVIPTAIGKAAHDSKFVLKVHAPSAWLKVAWDPATDPYSVQQYGRWSKENEVMDELSIERAEARTLITEADRRARSWAAVWEEESGWMANLSIDRDAVRRLIVEASRKKMTPGELWRKQHV